MSEEDVFQQAISKIDRNEKIARKYLEDHAHRSEPILELPLAHKVIPPRHLRAAEPGEVKCGAKARLEQDTPFAKVRGPVSCELATGHEGPHFSFDGLPPSRFRFMGSVYRWT
jgi:hypothetical protein